VQGWQCRDRGPAKWPLSLAACKSISVTFASGRKFASNTTLLHIAILAPKRDMPCFDAFQRRFFLARAWHEQQDKHNHVMQWLQGNTIIPEKTFS
jgi:hypothetical protein